MFRHMRICKAPTTFIDADNIWNERALSCNKSLKGEYHRSMLEDAWSYACGRFLRAKGLCAEEAWSASTASRVGDCGQFCVGSGVSTPTVRL